MTKIDSPAVTLALAHAEAWNHHDWDTARTMLAPDVHVISMTTQPNLPATDVTGTDAYMEGLIKFAQAIKAIQLQLGALSSSWVADEGTGLPRPVARSEEARVTRERAEPDRYDVALLAIA